MAKLEKIVRLCQKHGFILPTECLIDGRTRTCYNYGPLGCLLRNNIKQEWLNAVVVFKDNIFPVENTPLAESSKSNEMSIEWKTSRSDCTHNHYKFALDLVNKRLPFGLAQTGTSFKSYKNEQEDTDKFLYGSPVVTEMVLRYYFPQRDRNQVWHDWRRERISWWKNFSNSPSSFVANESAGDFTEAEISFNFPWGKDTIENICNLGDITETGNKEYLGRDGRKSLIPLVLESVTILERAVLAYLIDAYEENGKSNKAALRLHHRLAPYKVAILTRGQKTDELLEVAEFVSKELKQRSIMHLHLRETSATLGSQQTRFDEMGVPYQVIVGENTLKNGEVLVRSRETTRSESTHITEMGGFLTNMLA